jgi:hypothetical protein
MPSEQSEAMKIIEDFVRQHPPVKDTKHTAEIIWECQRGGDYYFWFGDYRCFVCKESLTLSFLNGLAEGSFKWERVEMTRSQWLEHQRGLAALGTVVTACAVPDSCRMTFEELEDAIKTFADDVGSVDEVDRMVNYGGFPYRPMPPVTEDCKQPGTENRAPPLEEIAADTLKERYPHTCRSCGSPCWEGPMKLECSNPACYHAKT